MSKQPRRPMAGGEFIFRGADPRDVLTPERLDADTILMAGSAADFLRKEVLPAADRIEAKEPGLMPDLLRRAASLGLLATDIPESYGGLGLSKAASARIAEALAAEPSFGVSHSVHTTVAALPLVFSGSPQQKLKYLPRMASGEILGAFALSESQSASDALSARTRAVLSADGKSYLLTGEKMWVTNGGFADLLTVFATTDKGLTAFLVERGFPGVSVGREEHKLGIKGSSTCRVILENAAVPVENRLGAEGEGGRIALRVLNLGRFKIAASAVGQSKHLLGIATRYAKERKAFGQPIAGFGLIQEKLATMAARIFATESMLYRLAGCLDSRFEGIESAMSDISDRYSAAAEECAIECALVKVYCTETLGYVADETLQIHGGYGYTEEFPAARAWRDARVARIYEGTSEINRLAASGQLLKRIHAGRLEMPKSIPVSEDAVARLDLAGRGRAMIQRLLQALTRSPEADREEIRGAIADMMIALFAGESASLRARVLVTGKTGPKEAAIACSILLQDGVFETLRTRCKEALTAYGDAGFYARNCTRQLLEEPLIDQRIPMRQIIAKHVLAADGYIW